MSGSARLVRRRAGLPAPDRAAGVGLPRPRGGMVTGRPAGPGRSGLGAAAGARPAGGGGAPPRRAHRAAPGRGDPRRVRPPAAAARGTGARPRLPDLPPRPYRDLLRVLRAELPARTLLSITVLPDWLRARDFPSLSAAVDRLVLQVHAADDPRRGLFDRDAMLRWVAAMDRRSARPFLVALPSYGVRVVLDPAGRVPSTEGERLALAGPDATELVVAPAQMADAVRALERAPAPPGRDRLVPSAGGRRRAQLEPPELARGAAARAAARPPVPARHPGRLRRPAPAARGERGRRRCPAADADRARTALPRVRRGATRFGHGCPAPDFAAAARLRWSGPLRQAASAARRHRRPLAASAAALAALSVAAGLGRSRRRPA